MDTGLDKNFTLKSILFIMFANLKLVLRGYTSLYGIFMSASLTLYIYNSMICVEVFVFIRLQSNSAYYKLLPKQLQ